MIGNDIVDLKFAKRNSRWQEQRFLDKVFTLQEQELLCASTVQFDMLWRLWSMKESVYKMSARADNNLLFNPKVYCCEIANDKEGRVFFKNESYSTETKMHQYYVTTTAFMQPQFLSKIVQLSHSDYPTQHIETVHHTKIAYAKLKNVTYNAIDIQKDRHGVPQVFVNGEAQSEQISLTHHGHFGAFAITAGEF